MGFAFALVRGSACLSVSVISLTTYVVVGREVVLRSKYIVLDDKNPLMYVVYWRDDIHDY